MHLAISGIDLNVYGSAPELKQFSRTWQQKDAKFLVFGLRGTASQPNFFNGDGDLPGHFLAQIIIFDLVEKWLKTQNLETKKCFQI